MGLKLTKDKDITFNVSNSSKNHDSSQSQDNSISNEKNNIKIDERKVKTSDKNVKKISNANTSASVNMEASLLKLIKKHNKDREDKELIDSCLQNHFFLRILEKNAR